MRIRIEIYFNRFINKTGGADKQGEVVKEVCCNNTESIRTML